MTFLGGKTLKQRPTYSAIDYSIDKGYFWQGFSSIFAA